MALFEKRWLFNEKHRCLPGEVAFTTAWITRATLIVAGLTSGTLEGAWGDAVTLAMTTLPPGYGASLLRAPGHWHRAPSHHVVKIRPTVQATFESY